MQIRFLFDDLKKIGKKKYYFKNGDEELVFFTKTFEIEIFRINNELGIIINYVGDRKYYLDSNVLSLIEKKKIKEFLDKSNLTQKDCKSIAHILLFAMQNISS